MRTEMRCPMKYEVHVVMLNQPEIVRTCDKVEFKGGFLVMHNPKSPYGPPWDETVIGSIPLARIDNVWILQDREPS